MARFFTHYWTNRTWEDERASGDRYLGHTASNQFRRRGVEPGDFIYVVTVADGRLVLGCGLEVGQILDQAGAEERLGNHLWQPDDHVIARRESEMSFDRVIPTETVMRLRFIAGKSTVALTFEGDGRLDKQTLRGVRRLTPESAQLLDGILGMEADNRGDLAGEPKLVRTSVSTESLDQDEILVQAPDVSEEVGGSSRQERSYRGRRVDHAATDAANRLLGQRGEEFVVEYERQVLSKAGRPDLASKVRRVSETEGDGAGYDVLSFNPDGREKYVEVKTTTDGKLTPFFVTINEVQFSEDHSEDYFLYRLFDLDERPRMFVLKGCLMKRCRLEAVQFRARF